MRAAGIAGKTISSNYPCAACSQGNQEKYGLSEGENRRRSQVKFKIYRNENYM